MHLSALLDFDVIPLDTDDLVTVLVDLTAPEQRTERRPPATLQIVLDRSGSMAARSRGGSRLQGTIETLRSLVDRLDPTDNFGLVSFSDEARVEVPAGPLSDKAAVKRRISELVATGSTDLSSGLLRGVQEARRVCGDRGATLLLVSDGHANRGITDHDRLADYARSAYRDGVTTTTLGYGLGYDEELLGAIADGGAGSALFAEEPDTAGQLIDREVDYLLAKTVQAASLRVPVGPQVRSVSVIGELPSNRLADGSVVVELGDFYSGERRRLMLRLEVPAIAALGPATVTTLEVTCVDPASLSTYQATLPISVNVVPGDAAAGRVPEPAVRVERAFQEAQTAKREASEALRRGERERAAQRLESARADLANHLPSAPEDQSAELRAQITELGELAARAQRDDPRRVSKEAYSSQSGYSRRRGRMSAYPEPAGQGAREPAGAATARAYAALEGLSVGDAFGEQFFVHRGLPADETPPPPWRWTDDTEMACSVVDVLVRHGRVDQDALAEAFASRFDVARGYGAGALELLERVRSGAPWREVTAAQFGGSGSFGNGAAMRVAPLGAYFAADPDRATTEAALSAGVTHTHTEGVAGAVAVAVAASVVAGDPEITGADLLDTVLPYVPGDLVRGGLERARALLGHPAREVVAELGNGSRISAQDTVPFTLWVVATHPEDYPTAVRTCVRAGGDIDTTSAITGGVLAARLGVEALPARWRAAREPLPGWLPR